MKKKRLGEVLRERGHITPADLTKLVEEQHGKLILLGELMLERGVVAKKDLGAALTEVTRVPYSDCDNIQPDPELLKVLPYAVAKRCCALPLQSQGTKLVVIMAEPQNLHILDEIRFSTGMDIITRLAFRSEIQAAIEKWYTQAEEAESSLDQVIVPAAAASGPRVEFISSSSLQRNIDAMQEIQAEITQKTTPAVRIVVSTITAAATKSASDIHIEPRSTDTIVRLRVDGMLRDFQHIPRSTQNSLVSRIKILADMNIAERRAPQDGRFLVKLDGRKIDLRVSTLPTQYGEKVVMRLLESDAPMLDFSALGIPPEVCQSLLAVLSQPQGMLLVTGPTGSGKSTTLYSSLQRLKKPTVNIVTVEDPIEYVVPGVNQVQVNIKAGLTFANCLRSILRQDPNVIMIGEIRDKETAEIAIKAAQTGHLVLSTLHTNDSVSAVTRLIDLGVPGFQIASSVSGVIAQRLVRRLCACHQEVPPTLEYVSRLLQVGVADPPSRQCLPIGCDLCDMTGYKGRIGVYEMLLLNEGIRGAVRSGGRNDEVRALARQNGMKLMHEYALDRVQEGLTTLEEVMRVIPFEQVRAVTCDACRRELSAAFLFCPFCGERRARFDAGERQHALVGHEMAES